MDSLTDAEALRELESKDIERANRAAQEVLKRSAHMLSALLSFEGDKRLFAGTALLNPRASVLLPFPVDGGGVPESAMDRATTLEVAALYLICAIYYGKLPFANAPLLVDLTIPKADRDAVNKRDYLDRAYQSARQWIRETQEIGLEAMRKRKRDPISSANLRWY